MDRNRLALFLHVSFSSRRTFKFFLSQNKIKYRFVLYSAVCEGCGVVFASSIDP